MIILKSLLILLIIFETSYSANDNEVIGCGGFIKSNTEINYKIIKVKLLTKDRVVKYTTESSPVNGYYMIPIYTKGEYILQVNPPPGWSFEPAEIKINVDGQTDACSKNEDINFFFKGFGLSGQVATFGDVKKRGPAGIKLNLMSNDKAIDSTLSGSDGSYYFSNVMPGSYQVEAEHSSIKFSNKRVNVELSKNNWSAKDNIVVSGYKIEGHLLTTTNQPIKNALVQLHFNDNSFSNINTKEFVCDLRSKSALRICHLKTDSNGKFTFSNIAFGKYKLTTSFNSDNLQFSMSPASLDVDLTKHENIVLTRPFTLAEVSISSQALLSTAGQPIKTGEVYINGQKSATQIDPDTGKFTLTGLTSGSYKIQIKSKNVYFEEKLVNIDLKGSACLDPSNSQNQRLQSLTKFVAVAFDVCGKVSVIKEQNINDLHKLIQIKCYQSHDSKLIKSVSVDHNLEYCAQLSANANFILKAEIADAKLARTLKLVPLEKKITVANQPVLDVHFDQLEAKLNGKIVLLPNGNNEVSKDLVVTIKSQDSSRAWKKDIPIKCEKNICHFTLTNLLFGDYLLTTNHDDLLCWKDQQKITINSENQNYALEQQGFILNYQLSHSNAVLKIGDLTRDSQSTSGHFCLSEIKDYNLVIDSCHKYTDTLTDTDIIPISRDLFKKKSNSVSLRASKVRVDLTVQLMLDANKKAINGQDLHVNAIDQNEKSQTIHFKLTSQTANELVFSARGWFEPNHKIRFEAQSNQILFEQPTKSLVISETTCSSNRIKFDAKLGIFITGRILPNNLDNVELTLTSSDDNAILDRTLVADGFKLGPLKPPHTHYNVELNKSGFLFTKKLVSSTNSDEVAYEFTAEKLGQLKVKVVDKKLNHNLDNVLLSFSSENRQFRQTDKTNSEGEATFTNLKPGLYYLIVMMQEYEFEPNSIPIRITDGDQMDLKVDAHRIAYSCIGTVSSINGQAEANIQIEALGVPKTDDPDSDPCSQSQESASVQNGNYHIFNLIPQCQYTLKLKDLNNQLSRVIPETYSFTIADTNILDKNFVLLEHLEKVDVTLAVTFKAGLNHQASLLNNYVKVKLFKMNQPDLVVQTQYAPANSIIYFNPVRRDPTQQYSVQVSLLATSSVYIFGSMSQQQQMQLQNLPVIESVEIGFYTDAAHKHVSAIFDHGGEAKDYFKHDHNQQQYQNVYMTLPLFVFVIGILLNSKRVQLYLLAMRNQIENKGGLVKAVQSKFQSAQNAESLYARPNRLLKKKHKRGLNSDSSATESDMERSKYTSRQHPVQNESVFSQDKVEIENYEIINNEDVMDMQISNRKQRVKRVD